MYCLLGAASGPLIVACVRQAEDRPAGQSAGIRTYGVWDVIVTSAFAGTLLLALSINVGHSAALPAWSWMALLGTVLALVDLRCHRLPHKLVAAMFTGGVVLLGGAGWTEQSVTPLLRALLAAATVFVVSLVVAIVAAPQVGFGDVTLSATLSLFLGWSSWNSVLCGLLFTVALSSVTAVALLITRRIGPRDPIAQGPALVTGAMSALLLQGP